METNSYHRVTDVRTASDAFTAFDRLHHTVTNFDSTNFDSTFSMAGEQHRLSVSDTTGNLIYFQIAKNLPHDITTAAT